MKKIIKYIFKKIDNLFLWSSGADLDILNQVPMEKSKYFGIGGTIIFTALMASFAGGYAFFTAFKTSYLAIPFGIFWGSLIFNLDRYIVASFGVGDGKKTISKQEVIEAAPRIAMAIILGFVISTPLELKLFEKEINARIDTNISTEQTKIITDGENDPKLISLKNDLRKTEKDIEKRDSITDSKRKEWANAVKDKNDEWNTGKFSSHSGKGEYYDGLNQKAKAAENDYNLTEAHNTSSNNFANNKVIDLNSKIASRQLEITKDIAGRKTIHSQNDGLLARLTALSELTSASWTLLFSKWLITILFIFIEIAPILFKMMTERGPYDDIVDRKKHEYKVRQLELQSNINQEINTAVKIHTDKYEQKLNAELQSNKEILEAIAKAQQEIAIVAIEKWKEEQKELMKQNGTGIIKSNV